MPNRRHALLALSALLIACLALAACGGDDSDGDSGQQQTAAVEDRPEDQAQQAGSEAAPEEPTGEEPPGKPTLEGNGIPAEALTAFATPTGNIGCVIDSGSARCDIAERSFSLPPQPADCQLDFGQGVAFSGGEAASLVCAGDTTLNPDAPVLAYGKVARIGRVFCQSAPQGISCSDQESGHGFFLSRERYQAY